MLGHLFFAVKHILGRDVPGSEFSYVRVFPDDTFIVSYPKSGNTWVRFLIANLLNPDQPVTMTDMEQIVPHCEAQSRRFFRLMPRPRIIKCHRSFDPRFKRVIYVLRDPRDVVVSQYYFQKKGKRLDDSYPIQHFVARFMAGETSPYGTWSENVTSWLALRQNDPAFLLLHYERMLADPVRELARIAKFLGLNASQETLVRAVQRSSADEMRKLESLQSDQWAQTKGTRKDIPFIRSARSGGWKSALPKECVAEMEAAWGPLMNRLGYEMSTPEQSDAGRPTAEKLSKLHVVAG